MLRRSSGELTYFASDIAYHKNKVDRGFLDMIDVFGADHSGHVKRMKAAVAARQALSAEPDWASVGRHSAYLLVFTLLVGYLSTRAFRTYQRSV